ncbi:glutaredoxin [Vermiconidia calcicola]|uniref:Glutaredoxin n=1 Tax=Vermiconidia calcicola TaxID=1690605 RepID=A0ACC3NB50_9PEZI|nr:glutaredoxin [Vermiconidia calcicola]
MSTSAEGQPCALQAIPSESAFNEHITALPSSCLAVIYFHAPWAEPCKQMSTILSTLASTFPSTSPPRISFLSLDAEEVSDVSEDYDVTQVPLVVLQKDGQVVESITGTDAAKVRSAVEKHTSAAGGGEGASRAGLPPAQTVTKPEPSQQTPQDAPAPTTTNGASAQQPEPEDLNTRLTTLVKAAPVMLFMKGTPSAPQCGFSRQTVSMLREKGVRYGFFNILADDEVRQGLKEYSEWPTFPQVYVGGELVGGLDILKEEFESDPEFLKEYSVHAPAQAA